MRSSSCASRSSTTLILPPIAGGGQPPTLSAAADGRLFGMRARRLLPVLLVLAAVAVGATGCFESKVANTTISGEITVGEGSTAQTVNPAEAGSTEASTQASTEQGSTGETATTGG